MMIAARQIAFGGSAKKWENPYITDGLVAMWDGEWNAGGGKHDANINSLIDLSGNGFNIPFFGEPIVNDNNVHFQAGSGATFSPGQYITSDAFTIGLLFQKSTQVTNAIFSSGSGRYITSDGKNVIFRNGGSGVHAKVSADTVSTPVSVAVVCDYVKRSLAIFINGSFKGEYINENIYLPSSWTIMRFNGEYKLDYLNEDYKLFNSFIMNRALTAEEVAYNYEIDKARFGL